jgi:TDG/mug DNA glycosylase family protein
VLRPPSSDSIATLTGLGPVWRSDARVLILGSFPGELSLARQQYYAHPRNGFWPIMGALTGARPELPYAERLAHLQEAGIALWDVLGACNRSGSLDSNIREAAPNDFAPLFAACPQIARVLLNGGTAAKLFDRQVWPNLDARVQALPRLRLPSTSPANAGIPFDAKLAAWRDALAA